MRTEEGSKEDDGESERGGGTRNKAKGLKWMVRK